MARYRVREHCLEFPTCDCGTEARFEIVRPNGSTERDLYCSECAAVVASDLNARLTNSQEGDEVR